MIKTIWLIFLLGCVYSGLAKAEDRYTEDTPPSGLGWESALKFFNKNSTSAENTSNSTYSDSAFFFDQTFFVNTKYASEGLSSPRWGLNIGYEWDQSWYGNGLYLNYVHFNDAEKYSMTGGFYFPSLSSGFPVYIRTHLGLGYYSSDVAGGNATFDYNAALGLRFFSSNNWLFNLEVGSRNQMRIFKSESLESIIVGSGLAVTF